MIFHVVANIKTDQGRKYSAYGLFSSAPDYFSALLEDPSGDGKQFLVSKQGHSEALHQQNDQTCVDAFFHRWRSKLEHQATLQLQQHAASPAIACLMYAAYEAGRLIESLPAAKTEVPGPLLWILYPDFSLCFEHDAIHVAAHDDQSLQLVLRLLEESIKPSHEMVRKNLYAKDIVQPCAHYKQAVQQVKEYIAAGDVFQANIARFWSMPFAASDLWALYDQLRQVNAAPFASFVDIEVDGERLYLISASPERLFRLHADGKLDTRPIAGTRRRAEGDQDDALRHELLLSEKERAEHIMLVDLERNDLGRVCKPGSVEVNECMVVEQYATVQHIVSNVCGVLDQPYDVIDVFKAMFPGGTITGCPKVRCMEIIHELEHNARGPYTGGLGYVAWDGSADMNILIRTFWHHHGQLHWAAGAGIVADSDPEHELVETNHKVAGLLRAFQQHG